MKSLYSSINDWIDTNRKISLIGTVLISMAMPVLMLPLAPCKESIVKENPKCFSYLYLAVSSVVKFFTFIYMSYVEKWGHCFKAYMGIWGPD